MTLNGAIMQLVEMRENSMMPNLFKPYFDKVIETISECVEPSEIPQWIPVSERLPEVHPLQIDEPDGQFNIAEDYCVTSDLVLVQTTDGRMAVALYEDDLDGRTYWETDICNRLEVVAWMPLPEPYREEDK